MNEAYKQLGIVEGDPDIIEIASEQKSGSAKSITAVIGAIFFGGFGLFCLIATLGLVIYTIVSFVNKSMTTTELVLMVGLCILAVPIGGGIGSLFFMSGIAELVSKTEWYLALMKDNLRYAIYNGEKKSYDKHVLPIEKLKGFTILQTEHVSYIQPKGRAPIESIRCGLSFHLQYENNGSIEDIHLSYPDGTSEMNHIINTLQNEYLLPIYYAFAPGEAYNYEKRNEAELFKQVEKEAITFQGSIEGYQGEDYTRKVSMKKALQSTGEYIKKKKAKEEAD